MTAVELSPQEVQQGLAANEILLIDVREAEEFAQEHIAGARCVPLSSFDPRALPAEGATRVVFHYGIGKRSAMAIEKCRAFNIDHHSHLRGGLQAWKSAGLPTTKK